MDKNKIITLDGLKDYDTLIKEWCPVKPDSNAVDGIINGNLTIEAGLSTTNSISAPTIIGNLKGNADTATKATRDANNNIITSTYAASSSLTSGSLVPAKATTATNVNGGIVSCTSISSSGDIVIADGKSIGGNNTMYLNATYTYVGGGLISMYNDSNKGRISLDKLYIKRYGSLYLEDYYSSGGAQEILCNTVNSSIFGNTNSFVEFGTSQKNLRLLGYDTIKTNVAISQGSDMRLKNSIEKLSDAYDVFFDGIIPYRYKINDLPSNKYSTGFVAQNIKSALDKANLTESDFHGLYVPQDLEIGTYSLVYDEFIALNTDQIQKLKTRVSELEAQNILLNARIEALESKLSA